MITITLEGNTWQDILDEMAIIQDAAKASRIEDNPGKGIVAPDKRECHDGPICPNCGRSTGPSWLRYQKDGKMFCSSGCVAQYDQVRKEMADCVKCHARHTAKLASILDDRYGLGPEERAEILERVR